MTVHQNTESNPNKVDKLVLDACCGGRMFWYDKSNPIVVFQDQRSVQQCIVGEGKNARAFEVQPDVLGDFRDMKFPNESFFSVIFDPPHLSSAGSTSYMAIKYGKLNLATWKDDIRKGFAECFRVLKENGTLVFKWNEVQHPLSDLLKLTHYSPLVVHVSGKKSKTHWAIFIKNEAMKKSENTPLFEEATHQPTNHFLT
jgi:SAM-dependent methyltransferase